MARKRKRKDNKRLHSAYPNFHKGPCDADCSAEWFTGHEIVFLNPEKRRTVILNPGKDVEWFKKKYPVFGELVLTRKRYISDLPQNMEGQIIAVSAVKGKDGKIRPKPISKFFELFESADYRVWTNPTEYLSKYGKKRRNKNAKKILSVAPKKS